MDFGRDQDVSSFGMEGSVAGAHDSTRRNRRDRSRRCRFRISTVKPTTETGEAPKKRNSCTSAQRNADHAEASCFLKRSVFTDLEVSCVFLRLSAAARLFSP